MTKQQILKYNSVSEDFHVMDVIAEKLKLVHNLAITYGNITLNEMEELLYEPPHACSNYDGTFTNCPGPAQLCTQVTDVFRTMAKIESGEIWVP